MFWMLKFWKYPIDPMRNPVEFDVNFSARVDIENVPRPNTTSFIIEH